MPVHRPFLAWLALRCDVMYVQTNEQELMCTIKQTLMSAGREYWDEFTKVSRADGFDAPPPPIMACCGVRVRIDCTLLRNVESANKDRCTFFVLFLFSCYWVRLFLNNDLTYSRVPFVRHSFVCMGWGRWSCDVLPCSMVYLLFGGTTCNYRCCSCRSSRCWPETRCSTSCPICSKATTPSCTGSSRGWSTRR